MSEIIISVRDRNNTYSARFGKLVASCTGGSEQAVERLARKIFGDLQRVDIVFLERIGLGEEEWKVSPDLTQRCRVCGCSWDKACAPDGCHWIEQDLCSCCNHQTSEVRDES
jgi:hypothetical protein